MVKYGIEFYWNDRLMYGYIRILGNNSKKHFRETGKPGALRSLFQPSHPSEELCKLDRRADMVRKGKGGGGVCG